jgi:hypothetical protein
VGHPSGISIANGGGKHMIFDSFFGQRTLPKHHYGNRKYTCGKQFQKLCSKSHKFPLIATGRGNRSRLCYFAGAPEQGAFPPFDLAPLLRGLFFGRA